jgi:short-subunit dehydrogenase
MRLKGKSVLVTGATGGIGNAIAREMTARGCVLTVTGRRQQELAKLAADLGPPTQGFAADLTEPAGIRDLLDRVGRVDVVVANAGVEVAQDLAVLSDARVEEAVQVNLLAPAVLIRALLEPMKQRGEGHIVLISSVAGLVATPGNGTMYTATKWGLRGLGLALRQELYGTGVGVSTIFPGPIRDAGMFARTGVKLPRGAGTNSPQDVARAVARSIERNRPETTVAAGSVRLMATVGAVAPVLVGTLSRRMGAGRVRDAMVASRHPNVRG